MIIYHITNNTLTSTQVIHGAGKSVVSHGTFVWDKHKDDVALLQNESDVYVTGATHVGAVYEGMYASRENYCHYLEI